MAGDTCLKVRWRLCILTLWVSHRRQYSHRHTTGKVSSRAEEFRTLESICVGYDPQDVRNHLVHEMTLGDK